MCRVNPCIDGFKDPPASALAFQHFRFCIAAKLHQVKMVSGTHRGRGDHRLGKAPCSNTHFALISSISKAFFDCSYLPYDTIAAKHQIIITKHQYYILIGAAQVRRTALGFQRETPFGATTGDRRGDGDTVRVNNWSRACIQSVSCLSVLL